MSQVNWCRKVNITHFIHMYCEVVYVCDPIHSWSPFKDFCVLIALYVWCGYKYVSKRQGPSYCMYVEHFVRELCVNVSKKSILPEVVSSVLADENESKLSETLYLVLPLCDEDTSINSVCVHQQSTETLLYNVHVI